jgi:translation initiation factor IF-2
VTECIDPFSFPTQFLRLSHSNTQLQNNIIEKYQLTSMTEDKMMRLSLVAKQIGVGTSTIVQKLSVQGHKVENNPNAKLNFEQLKIVAKEFGAGNLLQEAAPIQHKATEEEVFVPAKRQEDDYLPLYSRNTPKTEPVAVVTEAPKVEKAPEPEKVEAKAEVIPAKPVIVEQPKAVEPVKVEETKPVVVEAPKAVEPVKVEEAKPVVVEAPKAVEPVKVEEAKPVVVEAPKAVEPVKVEEAKPVIVQTAKPVDAPKPQFNQQNNQNQPRQQGSGQGNNNQNQPRQQGGGQGNNNQNRQQGGGQGNNNNQNRQQGGGQGGNNQNRQQRDNQPIRPQGGINQILPSRQAIGTPIGVGNIKPPQPQPVDNKVQKLGRNDAIPEDTSSVELIEAKGEQLRGLKVLGKIELPVETPRGGNNRNNNKKKRKRIDKPGGAKVTETEIRNERGVPRPKKDGTPADPNAPKPANTGTGTNTGNRNTTPGQGGGGNSNNHRTGHSPNYKGNKGNPNTSANPGAKPVPKGEVTEKQIQDQIKATMARLQGQSNKSNFGAKERREKRKFRADRNEQRQLAEDEEAKVLKVTEYISASELASLMDVSINEVISACMSLGMFISINQRLEADVIALITEEFGFEVQFVSAEEEIDSAVPEEPDSPEDLLPRAPIVTIMGHVDHGKTSLLDYIRRAKVAAGEAGGITQHIGAYSVKQDDGRRVTFLDTPGHEAFTAMRARGAKVTDVAIIVIAADDAVMPQTEEAINHAMVAGVPIVFAFSKVDKPGANTEKIREQLSIKNILVEEWGGKYQTQEISSKSGAGVNELLEKVLLEAELLDLKANANKRAVGTVVEASLDKGRGYVANILVQAGTLKVGDMMLAGAHYGRVKAMFDYRGNKLKEAGPSIPVQVLGLGGAPAAGDKLSVMENERDAREIANKREQIIREQSLRTRKHITLEEIGRRKAIGTFKELNVIVKGDVDGSVEALSDSLLKLSTEEVQVRIIHKGVGQVSESDVLLASASDAVIVAFQVRPSTNARRLAENEQIEIRTYSIIYQAIDDVRDAMEGLLAPKFEEVVTANIEVRDVFKITKVGTVAGAYVLDGTVKRSDKIRIIRDFVVVHEGEISALKRFKDDVASVKFGYECGLSIKNFNDIEIGDVVECYEMKELKRTL